MASTLAPIAANDPATRHADWLELTALAAADRNRSLQDLIQVIRRSGTAEEAAEEDPRLAEYDRGSEVSEAVAEAAFRELEARGIGCGGGYPYTVDGGRLEAVAGAEASIYVFMLLLAAFGAKAGPSTLDALAMFDQLAASAVANYIHGDAYLFGFPRRVAPRGFANAVDDLTRHMGEVRGTGSSRRPGAKRMRNLTSSLGGRLRTIDRGR